MRSRSSAANTDSPRRTRDRNVSSFSGFACNRRGQAALLSKPLARNRNRLTGRRLRISRTVHPVISPGKFAERGKDRVSSAQSAGSSCRARLVSESALLDYVMGSITDINGREIRAHTAARGKHLFLRARRGTAKIQIYIR